MPWPSFISFFDRLKSSSPPARPNSAKVDRKQVRTRLVEALGPMLIANGFGRFKNTTTWRHSAHWVDVVEIKFIKTYTTSRHSPSLHVGRYLSFVPEPDPAFPVRQENGRYFPTPEECHIRRVVFKPQRDSRTPANIWLIGEHGEGLDQCVQQVVQVTHTEVLPWFRWLDDTQALLDLVTSGKADIEGKSRDPLLRGTWNYADYFGKHVVGGFIAVELERWDLALELFEPVLRQGGTLGRDNRLFPLPDSVLHEIRGAAALARERAGK